MAKTNTAAFAQDPQTFGAVLTAAGNPNGSDAVELYTAGTEGCLVTRISAAPVGTITASGVIIFVQKNGSAVKVPRFSVVAPTWDYAVAGNKTAKLPVAFVTEISEQQPLRLGRGDKLFATSMVANLATGIAVSGEVSEFKDVGEAV